MCQIHQVESIGNFSTALKLESSLISKGEKKVDSTVLQVKKHSLSTMTVIFRHSDFLICHQSWSCDVTKKKVQYLCVLDHDDNSGNISQFVRVCIKGWGMLQHWVHKPMFYRASVSAAERISLQDPFCTLLPKCSLCPHCAFPMRTDSCIHLKATCIQECIGQVHSNCFFSWH